MAVSWFRNPVLEETAPIVDRASVNERTFGVSSARRCPAYVYSVSKTACLMHKVREVEIHYYATVSMGKLGRLKQPAMIAHTVCGVGRPLTPDRSRTCKVPLPGSVLCGRCHGEPATFGKHGKGTALGIKRREAGVMLGCIVAGYPSSVLPHSPTVDEGTAIDARPSGPEGSPAIGSATNRSSSSSFTTPEQG